jgi:hypothetical protein
MHCRADLPTAGLGNKLFPWARCRIFALEHHIPMLAPGWTQVRLRALLRGDRDKRVYHNLFVGAPRGYVKGPPALWLRLFDRHPIVFSGPANHFDSLTNRHQLLLMEIRHITRPGWLRRVEHVGPVPIGVHVRRGDFVEPRRPDDFVFKGGIRTPLGWYIRCLEAIRDISHHTVPAVVVSDAPDSALGDLLRMPNVERVDTGSAIGDLLVLSRARMLLGSGGSSFSAWAAFLGQMPAVAYPGQSLSWFKIAPTRGQYIGEWNHARPTPQLLEDQVQMLFEPVYERLA